MSNTYVFNAGQTHRYQPGEALPAFSRAPYEPAEIVTHFPALEVHPNFKNRDYVVIGDVTEKITGVTAEMVDWWWANMEKGYPLWAPGEHYGFEWKVPPCEVGYEGSVEISYEFNPAQPLEMTRISIEEYPFTQCMEHCWLTRTYLGEVEMQLVHMYEDTEDGIYWRTIQYLSKSSLAIMPKDFGGGEEERGAHMAYESGRLNAFLPQLYALWKDHPDPSQSVPYNLTVTKKEDGTWCHLHDNKPVWKADFTS